MNKIIYKTFPIALLILVVGFATIDELMLKFGKKKFFQLETKNLIIQDSLSEGLIGYRGNGITYFKWNITSLKEIDHKKGVKQEH